MQLRALYAHVRWWWLGLLAVVLVAAGLRLMSYPFSLPYVDHVDEPNHYLGAQEWRGLQDNNNYYAGFPPGYLTVQVITQVGLEALGKPGMTETVRLLRLLSVIADLVTIVLIAKTVRLVGSGFSALIAATSWAVAPIVLENNVYALPDPLNTLLAALALWLAANAVLVENRRSWAIWSVVVGLLATLLKYPALPVIAPGGVAALILFIHHPKQGFRTLLVQIALVGATLFWLFFIYGIPLDNVDSDREIVNAISLTNALDFNRVALNLYGVFLPIQPAVATVIIGAGLLTLFFVRRQNASRHRLLAILCVSLLVGIPWLVSSFTVVQADYRMRDVLPATVAACVLLGLAVDRLVTFLPSRRRWAGQVILAAALAGLVVIPQLSQDVALVQERRLPDLRVDLRQWFDVNLEPGTVIVDHSNHKTFNPIWGGLPYRHWVDWWESDYIMEHSVSEWRDQRGMSYAVLTLEQQQAMQQIGQGQAYLNAMLHLRDFAPQTPVRGPKMAVYRLWRMDHETDVTFGDHIRLIGFDQSTETAQPGDVVTFILYWNAPTIPTDNYSLFIHLVPVDEYTVLSQWDGVPAVPERLTLTWTEASETLISPPLPLDIPPDLPDGTYRVMIGLYNFETGMRLPVAGTDVYPLTELRVSG